MKLLYLTEVNLRDRLFVRDMIHNFKLAEKAILIHDTFGGTVSDTRFVTKRLSALMSETMIYNNAFSGDQRNFFSRNEAGLLQLNVSLVEKLLSPLQVLILGPVIAEEGKAVLADPIEMVQLVRNELEISETIVFTANPMSPLGAKQLTIDTSEDVTEWLKSYEEEKASLELAHELRPARIASPMTYSA
ncbi:MAG: hypothetical protein AAF927_05070 [Bacteroidota bacterium]